MYTHTHVHYIRTTLMHTSVSMHIICTWCVCVSVCACVCVYIVQSLALEAVPLSLMVRCVCVGVSGCACVRVRVCIVQGTALEAVPLSLMVRREVTPGDAQWAMTQVHCPPSLPLSLPPSLYLPTSPSLPPSLPAVFLSICAWAELARPRARALHRRTRRVGASALRLFLTGQCSVRTSVCIDERLE